MSLWACILFTMPQAKVYVPRRDNRGLEGRRWPHLFVVCLYQRKDDAIDIVDSLKNDRTALIGLDPIGGDPRSSNVCEHHVLLPGDITPQCTSNRL
jgi:hypothetical protein